jgi:hypothetical protein
MGRARIDRFRALPARFYLAVTSRIAPGVSAPAFRDTGMIMTDGAVPSPLVGRYRLAGRVSHPGVVRVRDYDDGSAGGVPHLVMEYVTGPSLAAVLRGGRAVSAPGPRPDRGGGRGAGGCSCGRDRAPRREAGQRAV